MEILQNGGVGPALGYADRVLQGGVMSFQGVAYDASIDGTEIIELGGQASGGAIGTGGLQQVSAGATHSEVVSGGGEEFVASGGFAGATTLSSGGLAVLQDGATAESAIVSNGGILRASSGSVTSETTVLRGGIQTVFASAGAVGTLLSGGESVKSTG